eukprot:gene16447-18658_t
MPDTRRIGLTSHCTVKEPRRAVCLSWSPMRRLGLTVLQLLQLTVRLGTPAWGTAAYAVDDSGGDRLFTTVALAR